MLPRIESLPLPERSLGWVVARWMEEHLVHGPGDIMGAPFRLNNDQLRFLVWAYALDEAGRRLYHRATLSRPKGCAKSELAAAICHAELSGPVRFGGWADDGEPVGVPVVSPSIPVAATNEDQADETLYGVFRVMPGPALAAELDVGLSKTYRGDGTGRCLVVTSSSAARDGARPSFTAVDEPHLWTTPELRRLWGVLLRNLRKRLAADPWMLATTTMYAPGERSVAEGEREYAEKVAAGEIIDARLLYDHRESDPRLDLDREDQLREAIMEARGEAAAFTNIDAIAADWHDPTTEEADFRRYWLNQVVSAPNAWLAKDVWDALERPGHVVAPGSAVAVGFDGSKTDDATGLVGCELETGHLFVLGVWEKPEGVAGRGWQVPVPEVESALAAAFERFDVARFYGDPAWWQDDMARWHSRWGDRVVDFWTHHETKICHAVERLETAVKTSGVTHDGHAVFRRHVLNARKRKTRVKSGDGKELHTLEKPRERDRVHKIDLAMAAVLAYEARCDAVASGYRSRSRIPVFV
jgi:phage terminase large subunit-like protein